MIRSPSARGSVGPSGGVRSRRDAAAEPPRFSRFIGASAVASAAALLVACALALNVNLSNLSESRALAFRASSILRAAAELHADLRAAETGQRGYILTGERRYLAPYEQALARVWTRYEELQRLVQDPGQKQRLEDMRPLVGAKLEELGRTVALRERSLEAALQVVRTDVGQRLMEEIDAKVVQFERSEQDILLQRTGRLEDQAAWTMRMAGLMGLLALASAVLGVLWFARQRAQMGLLAAERRFRRDLEGQVEERTAQLTQVNRELDAFAYTISHDLRAPLRAMHGYADALAEDYGEKLPEDGRRYTRRIIAAAERMEDLIQDILTYSRLAREEVSVRAVSLERVVDQVIANAAQQINEAGAEIRVERPLPDVVAHAPTLIQAVDNLVSNAIKFVAPDHKPVVTLRSERRDGRVRLSIQDDGIGIDAAHQERIFRPFERLHGAETYPGTGIGLAIVRRSLERMGGECGVNSNPGRGSRFWIELPAAEQEPAP